MPAILVCDQAIRELGSNKVTLVGIFDRIASPAFPFQYVRGLAVYARLTDAAGRYQMRLELVRLEDEQTIGRAEVDATITDRMGSHELTYNIALLVFERPGLYEFRLVADGRHLGGMTLTVVQIEAGQQEDPDAQG